MPKNLLIKKNPDSRFRPKELQKPKREKKIKFQPRKEIPNSKKNLKKWCQKKSTDRKIPDSRFRPKEFQKPKWENKTDSGFQKLDGKKWITNSNFFVEKETEFENKSIEDQIPNSNNQLEIKRIPDSNQRNFEKRDSRKTWCRWIPDSKIFLFQKEYRIPQIPNSNNQLEKKRIPDSNQRNFEKRDSRKTWCRWIPDSKIFLFQKEYRIPKAVTEEKSLPESWRTGKLVRNGKEFQNQQGETERISEPTEEMEENSGNKTWGNWESVVFCCKQVKGRWVGNATINQTNELEAKIQDGRERKISKRDHRAMDRQGQKPRRMRSSIMKKEKWWTNNQPKRGGARRPGLRDREGAM